MCRSDHKVVLAKVCEKPPWNPGVYCTNLGSVALNLASTLRRYDPTLTNSWKSTTVTKTWLRSYPFLRQEIYLGVICQITGPRPTPFTKASSEIRRTDRRGVETVHVLYMAMKVMRHNVFEKTMTFKTNAAASAFTRQQFEKGGRRFPDDVLNRILAFIGA
ncbi:hypothetical protein HPB52_013441 [Rhipicephalus sanguineus]|uniref:Uncharacterized protein n=1 Tax=Rhipicephalus sanguineus TaxID=34632 RepID=A0A9D4QB31_RHISA|nr:hypothetical protein HPB52_013441 [Rhipicephalus sanguineus]